MGVVGGRLRRRRAFRRPCSTPRTTTTTCAICCPRTASRPATWRSIRSHPRRPRLRSERLGADRRGVGRDGLRRERGGRRAHHPRPPHPRRGAARSRPRGGRAGHPCVNRFRPDTCGRDARVAVEAGGAPGAVPVRGRRRPAAEADGSLRPLRAGLPVVGHRAQHGGQPVRGARIVQVESASIRWPARNRGTLAPLRAGQRHRPGAGGTRDRQVSAGAAALPAGHARSRINRVPNSHRDGCNPRRRNT